MQMLSEFQTSIRKFNKAIRKLSKLTGSISTLSYLVIGVLYVYVPLPSTTGLILGILTAIAGAVSIGNTYYFNYTHNGDEDDEKDGAEKKSATPQKLISPTLYLAITLTCLPFNVGAAYFGMHTGLTLLAKALSLPTTSFFLNATIMAISCNFTLTTLINSWLTTYKNWQTLLEAANASSEIDGVEGSSARLLDQLGTTRLLTEAQEEPELAQGFSASVGLPLAHARGTVHHELAIHNPRYCK